MESPASQAERAAVGMVESVLEACAGRDFATFLCGCVPPPGLPPAAAEEWRRAFNRTLGTALVERWSGSRRVSFEEPELQIHCRPVLGEVRLEAAPLLVYGRYRKHSRSLPQTPFHCPGCRGRGCGACRGTGRLLPGSVAEFVLPALVEAAGAAEGTFHGCGREDADARMLGTGRPFVASLRAPRRRRLDLAACRAAADAAAAGAAEFPVLLPAGPGELARVTATHPGKRYLAACEVEGGATPADAAAAAAGLAGVVLEQRTPERVARRRADLVRRRRVLEASATVGDGGLLLLEVRTEGGTYVKEMVSGDGGRTTPSLAAILGRPARCVALDVLAVELDDPAARPTGPGGGASAR